MNEHIPAPAIVTIDGRPWWRFVTGELLPVISGGADDGDGGDGDDGGGDDGGDTDDGAGDDGGEGGEGKGPTVEQQIAAAKREADKWKSLARKHEKTAKQNTDAAEKLAAMEHAGKSEEDKLKAMLEQSQAEARSARVQALKLRVAAEKELDPRLAEFLPDLDDEVDMVAAAEKLQEAAGGTDTEAKPTRQPKSNLTNPLKDGDGEDQRDRLIAAMTGKSPLS